MIEIVIIIGCILLLSGFCSGAEAALVSISEADIEPLLQQKKFGATIVAKVKKYQYRSIITLVILNNIVNIVGSIVVGRIVIDRYGDAILAIITTGLTFGIIVFSEILPKSIGLHYRENVSLLSAPIVWLMTIVLLPIILFFEWCTSLLNKGHRKVGTEEEIRSLVSIGRRAGHIESDEGQLIHRAFILNDKKAGDIMTPLKDIVWCTDTSTVREAAQKVFTHTYSRYPVLGRSMHEVKGLVMSYDILECLAEGKDDRPIQSILREVLVVDSLRTADDLLLLFRDKHIHLAVVQHEGKTAGLVTLEDVLEELVGEIEDETDVED